MKEKLLRKRKDLKGLGKQERRRVRGERRSLKEQRERKWQKTLKEHNGFGKLNNPGMCPGYLTVEAALLLPLVIGVIIYVLYFQFFWYNRCLMDQEAAMTAVRAVQTGREAREEQIREIRKWRGDFLTDKYIGWEAQEPILTCRQDRISVRQKGRLPVSDTGWNAEVVYENKLLQPAVYLRGCRKMILRLEEKG